MPIVFASLQPEQWICLAAVTTSFGAGFFAGAWCAILSSNQRR